MWKLKQVKPKCQFKLRLIKEQKRMMALLLAKNSACCQVSSPAPLPGTVIFPWLSPAESQSAEGIFHGRQAEHTLLLRAQAGLRMGQWGSLEGSAGHITQPSFASRVVGAAAPPLAAPGNMCCADLAEKRSEIQKTQCRMGCF